MPTAKTGKIGRKNKPNVTRQKPLPEQVQNTVRDVADEVVRIAKLAKQRFDGLDANAKRKVITGLSGLAALLALRARHRYRKRHKG